MTTSFVLDGLRICFDSPKIEYNQLRLRFQQLATEARLAFVAEGEPENTTGCISWLSRGWDQLQPAWRTATECLLRYGATPDAKQQLLLHYLLNYFDWEGDGVCINQMTMALKQAADWSKADLFELPKLFARPSLPAKPDFSAIAVSVECLADRVYGNVVGMHLAVIDVLQQLGIKTVSPATPTDRVKATALQETIRSGWISQRELAGICGQMLALDPYNQEHYFTYLAALGDFDGALERMAVYFGVTGILEQKLCLIQDCANKALAAESQSELTQAFKQLVTKCVTLSVDPYNEFVLALEKRLI